MVCVAGRCGGGGVSGDGCGGRVMVMVIMDINGEMVTTQLTIVASMFSLTLRLLLRTLSTLPPSPSLCFKGLGLSSSFYCVLKILPLFPFYCV